jgi:hypothetical protein
LITINDYLVFKFLDKKISYQMLINLIYRISNLNQFTKFKKISVRNIEDIYKTKEYVSFKLNQLSV